MTAAPPASGSGADDGLPRLALFDLDHTLLSGDSDVLWCEFLITQGLLPASQRARNAALEAAYRAGTVSAAEFSAFFVGTLAGRSRAEWAPWLDRFLTDEVWPRMPAAALALVADHRARGDLLVLTTATNRLITERTAQALGFPHLIATEVGWDEAGRCTGAPVGTLNMREGKVARLHDWLAERGHADQARDRLLARAHFYSDSRNDLPLLSAVGYPVAVDPDPHLEAQARTRGWPVLRLDRTTPRPR